MDKFDQHHDFANRVPIVIYAIIKLEPRSVMGHIVKKQRTTLAVWQQGITLWHVLLLVAVAVSLAYCAKTDRLPVDLSKLRWPSISFNNNGSNGSNNNTWSDTIMVTRTSAPSREQRPAGNHYESEFPANLGSGQGYYTVQVFSGYNSKFAYDLRSSLRRDGYNTYISEEQTRQGILFKVRIGKYSNRGDAFAVSDKIRNRYPKNLGQSFVMLVDKR